MYPALIAQIQALTRRLITSAYDLFCDVLRNAFLEIGDATYTHIINLVVYRYLSHYLHTQSPFAFPTAQYELIDAKDSSIISLYRRSFRYIILSKWETVRFETPLKCIPGIEPNICTTK